MEATLFLRLALVTTHSYHLKKAVLRVCVLYTTLPVDLSVTWLCPAYYYYDKALPPTSVTTRLRMSKYLSRSKATVAMPSTEAVGAAKPLDISVEKSESSTNPPISCSLKKLSTRCKKYMLTDYLEFGYSFLLFVAYSGHICCPVFLGCYIKCSYAALQYIC